MKRIKVSNEEYNNYIKLCKKLKITERSKRSLSKHLMKIVEFHLDENNERSNISSEIKDGKIILW